MKKQTFVALILLLLVPVVFRVGGFLFSSVNPEIAAGHPNYVRNYHYLDLVKHMFLWGPMLVVGILWLVVCFLVIRSKGRSSWWLLLAALGPFGFAVLVMLADRAPAKTDRHERFVRSLNWFVGTGYQACLFVAIWTVAEQAMVLKRNLTIMYESATTGMSSAQIIDIRNASSGMWAFAEGNEVIYMMVLFYLIWPILFNGVARVAASPKAG